MVLELLLTGATVVYRKDLVVFPILTVLHGVDVTVTLMEKSFTGSSKVVGTDVLLVATASEVEVEVDVVVDHRVFLRLHGLRPNNASTIAKISKNPAMCR